MVCRADAAGVGSRGHSRSPLPDNLGWTNNYYDDMAWLALALERAQRMQLIDSRKALSTLESQLFDAWSPDPAVGCSVA
ncbi:hypothetical protein GS447_08380 [Rhodococcus hoagii]|nr:hypothetical protein [Prescottella equi]